MGKAVGLGRGSVTFISLLSIAVEGVAPEPAFGMLCHVEWTGKASLMWQRFGELLIETVYPRRCAGCGRRGRWVCDRCAARLTVFQPPWCPRCGAPEGQPNTRCRCGQLPESLDRVRSTTLYAGWLRQAIIAFKYEGERARADHLGACLVDAVAALLPADALVPVPLHQRRLRERGYNQAALLAHRVSAVVGVPVTEALIRTRPTPQQVGLDAARRQANVRGAFAAAPGAEVDGLRFILIDDVLTTGATLGACAEVLRVAGAASVAAATLAREG